jgi:hypothetical protein
VQKEGKKEPLEFVEISMKIGEKNLSYPTGKGGEFYIENSLSTDTKADAADSQNNQSCSAIAKLRKSGGNTILPGNYGATVDYEGGKCGFTVTFTEAGEAITDLGVIQCVVLKTSTSIPSVQTPVSQEGFLEKTDGDKRIKTVMPKDLNQENSADQNAPAQKQAGRTVLFAFPDAD